MGLGGSSNKLRETANVAGLRTSSRLRSLKVFLNQLHALGGSSIICALLCYKLPELSKLQPDLGKIGQ